MQVLVNVQIKAIDADNPNIPYTLSKAELASIRLIDYFTNLELANNGAGWVWSYNKSIYAGTLLSIGKAEFQQEADSQLVQFWVSTTNIEKKTIGASIRQPDRTLIITNNGAFNSFVTLKAEPPITYTYPENVGLEQVKMDSGVYQISTDSGGGPWSPDWDQVNYYLTTKDYPLLHCETNDFDKPATSWDSKTYPERHLEGCYAGQTRPDLSLFYLWKIGPETKASKQKAGFKCVVDPAPAIRYTTDTTVDITINDKKNSVCLTYLSFNQVPNVANFTLFGPSVPWSAEAKLCLYDIYGNCGHFKATYSERKDSIVIHNDN
ncbi:hypothetical protein GGI43DRAFT_426982 [Trichoderma evansii]